MPQKIWRKNFSIKRVDIQLGHDVIYALPLGQKRAGLPLYLKNYLWIIENGDNVGSYFYADEIRKVIDEIMKRMIKDPSWADKVYEQGIKYTDEYFKYAKSLKKKNLKKLSHQELNRLYKKLYKLQVLSHGISMTTTWFVDSDGEDFSNYLLKYTRARLKKAKIKDDLATVFSTLTTPLEDSFALKEEKETLRLVKLIQQSAKAKQIFSHPDPQGIERQLDELPTALKRKIKAHYQKWLWTPYTYIGPTYGLDYYLEVFAGLIREGIDVDAKLQEMKEQRQKIKHDQRRYLKELAIDSKHQHLFRVAQDIIFLKAYRKDIMYHGFYVLDFLLKEVARRLGLTLMQVKYMTNKEVEKALLNNIYSTDELNARQKFSLIISDSNTDQILSGEKAQKFLSRQKFEKEKKIKTDIITGTTASPGKVKGIVKIVNLPEDIPKMNKGDIMVSHTTFPALVPAMKKATAIVTEDGGITCHAAIVSRELKTPCVVGTKIATQVLKDGDKVEVDAIKGIVKKLS